MAKRTKKQPQRARPKRKMLIDEDVQLSSDQIRQQLSDASALVRDFAAEAAAASTTPAQAPRGKGASFSAALLGPPMLPYLPAAVATMPFFHAGPSNLPQAKRTRKGAQPHGEPAADGASPAAEVWRSGSDMASPEAPEVWRSSSERASTGEEASALHDAASPHDEQGGAARHQFDEPNYDDPDYLLEENMVDGVDALHGDGVDESGGAGFDPARELPDVDGNESPSKAAAEMSQSQSLGTADPSSWNQRTYKMYTALQGAFDESSGEPLSYNAMVAGTRSINKRKVVAGCFQELLFLTTHGIIELQQRKAYGNILVAKTELFDTAAAVH
jgi:hypothetical protein